MKIVVTYLQLFSTVIVIFSILCNVTAKNAAFHLEETYHVAFEPFETDYNHSTEKYQYRLPANIRPRSYKIRLTPYFYPDFKFDGIVEITTTVIKNTREIVLHASEIIHHQVKLKLNGTNLEITSLEERKKFEILNITVADLMTVGSDLIIEIIYTGKLNTALRGFYRSSYTDNDNNIRWLAASHLEPVGARKMFPCFDEPGLKATFQLSVNRPRGYKAISNTRLSSSVTEGDRVLEIFEETPVMSTYLVALIVSDFEKLSEEGIYSTYARPNAIDQAEYAVSVISPIIEFFEKTLGHKYQLPKLDMAAIPDFASGAMENWGLITFRENAMLYDKKHSPITSKQIIIKVIAHEIAHQWFGNLVSPEWWKYIWLSEGFARYYQYHATAFIEPLWNLESQFVVEQLQVSFKIDGLLSSHPMTHDVESPKEIRGAFDQISYAKAASIIRMIEKIIGYKPFVDSLKSYLTERKYKSANPDHLYEAIQKRVDDLDVKLNASVKQIMDSWTTQAGYPVVSVTRSGGSLTLSQKRFLLKNPDGIETKTTWWIPITWASKSKPNFLETTPKHWLSKPTETIMIVDPIDQWFILNVQQTGYYRVNYDKNSWQSIIEVLKSDNFEIIHEINRASIIDDILNLARTNHVDYDLALSVTEYLTQENNYIPWRAAFNGFTYLNDIFKQKDMYKLLKTHILSILQPIYKTLGFNMIKGESHTNQLLRRYVLDWACQLDDSDCVENSFNSFSNWKSNETQLVPVDLRGTIYCIGIKYGTPEDWNFLWNEYLRTNVRIEKITLMRALGCSKNSTILDEFLLRAISTNSGISVSSITEVFNAVYKSGVFGAEHTLDFVAENFVRISDYIGDNTTMKTILSGISEKISSNESVSKFEALIDTHQASLSEIKKSLRSYVTRARSNLDWFNLHSPQISSWLIKKYSPTPNLEKRMSTFDNKF